MKPENQNRIDAADDVRENKNGGEPRGLSSLRKIRTEEGDHERRRDQQGRAWNVSQSSYFTNRKAN